MNDAQFLKELITNAEWFHTDKIKQNKSLRIVWEVQTLSRMNVRFLEQFNTETFEDDGFFHFNITEVALDKMGLLALVKEQLELV